MQIKFGIKMTILKPNVHINVRFQKSLKFKDNFNKYILEYFTNMAKPNQDKAMCEIRKLIQAAIPTMDTLKNVDNTNKRKDDSNQQNPEKQKYMKE